MYTFFHTGGEVDSSPHCVSRWGSESHSPVFSCGSSEPASLEMIGYLIDASPAWESLFLAKLAGMLPTSYPVVLSGLCAKEKPYIWKILSPARSLAQSSHGLKKYLQFLFWKIHPMSTEMSIPSYELPTNICKISRSEPWLTHTGTSLKSLPSALSGELGEGVWKPLEHFHKP